MLPFTHHRRIAFYETDAGGIVHFSNYLRFAEEAELQALLSLGLAAYPSPYMLPRVHVEADYHLPLHFNDEIAVEAILDRIGNSSLHWRFDIRRSGDHCAQVRIVTVRTGKEEENGGFAVVPYTEEEREKFRTLLA